MSLGANDKSGKFKALPLGAAVLAGLFLFAFVPGARAESREACQRRVAHADHELHEAIEHHGYNSREAQRRRHELHEARERCWRENHGWWSEHERRWHSDRDWDDRDHDRDDRR